MKLTQRFAPIVSVILACVVGSGLLVLTAENAQAQTYSVPKPNLSYDIPVNSNIDFNPETNLGAFAWQAFVALNWPADCHGSPLKNKTIGEAPNAPRVWEFYHFPEDVFTPDAAKPNLQPTVLPPQCQGAFNNQRSDPVRILVEGQEPLVPLIDRAGNYILNEVRINPVEVNEIIKNEWYSAENLEEFNDTDNLFQLTCSALHPQGIYSDQIPCLNNDSVGAIELKIAWMVFPNDDPKGLRSKYYTTTRTFNVSTPEKYVNKVKVPVALVGFHVVSKTSQQAWIWATFEHIDNAPDAQKLPTLRNYNLYSSDCQENCETNRPYVNENEPYLWRIDKFPNAVTKTASGEIKKQIPSQITRVIPIPPIAQSLNSKWQKELEKKVPNSLWQNYQLVGVQWLENPNVPYNLKVRGMKPQYLANLTLEPYSQTQNSCITCHTDARLSLHAHADFSFLMKYARSPDSKRESRGFEVKFNIIAILTSLAARLYWQRRGREQTQAAINASEKTKPLAELR